MSAADIDQLIGTHFLPRNAAVKPPAIVPERRDKPRRSRFVLGSLSRFVHEPNVSQLMRESLAEHRLAQALKEQKKKHDMLTQTVPAQAKTRWVSRLGSLTETLRRFIVGDIAVFELALQAAMTEASDSIEQLTGSRVDALTLGRVQKAANLLVELHTTNKLCTVLGVPADVRKQVLSTLDQGPSNGKENMPVLHQLSKLLASRKGSDKPVRGLGETQAHQPRNRTAFGIQQGLGGRSRSGARL